MALTSKLGLLAIICVLSTWQAPDAVSERTAAPPCVTLEEANLIDKIGFMVAQMPGPASDGMLVPSDAKMQAWETVLNAVAQGDLAAACDTIAAHAFPYQIVELRDTGYDGAQYLVLEETMPASAGWGTYVIASEAESSLVIEVPHPGCELKTEDEGVELLRRTQARALLVAGTHRCANTTYSPCSGTTSFCGVEEPHRTSDVAHATQTIFFASHRALVPPGSGVVAVQLHGCADPACPDLFISNGTCNPGELALELTRQVAAACAPMVVDVANCAPPECPLVGTTNVQGRYSNSFVAAPGFDACTRDAPATSDSEQFLQLEQSLALRDDFGCLATALRRTFADLHNNYLPALSNRAVETPVSRVDTRQWNIIHRR